MNDKLALKISMLPEDSGVYVMLDKDGNVIYVGKAKVLKNRVKQYFYSNKKPEKVAAMVSNVADFYYIITSSEIDALSLENNLIKKYKPRYNILLKDDKTYPYIRVNLKDDFPAFSVTRKIRRDGARYFGPFMGGVNAADTLEIINVAFSVRTCAVKIDADKPRKPCLEYHLGKCLAPCAGLADKKAYAERVRGAVDFLSGADEDVEKLLTEKMLKFSALEEFELALSYRDKLRMLEKIKLKRITALNKFVDMDIIGVTTNGLYSAINALFVRGGRMQGGKNFALEDASETNAERLRGFITGYYRHDAELPDEIIVCEEVEDRAAVEEYIKSTYGKTVKISVPQKGVKKQLVEMAEKNAEDYLEKEVDKIKHKDDMTVQACKRLKEVLSLKRYPRRMECYDISHISGVDKVGSMVVFIDGEPDKNSYRRFRIKTVEGNNDFACLKEVLKRRLDKLKSDEADKFPRPDLIIIDGGKGQLSSVKSVFDEEGCDIDLISLAKREEEIYTVYDDRPITLSHRDYCLQTLQRIRDEAHRFAITYHRQTHIRRNLASELDGIVGIGEKKKKLLADKFGTVENIRRASETELAETQGIGKNLAAIIKEYFNENEE